MQQDFPEGWSDRYKSYTGHIILIGLLTGCFLGLVALILYHIPCHLHSLLSSKSISVSSSWFLAQVFQAQVTPNCVPLISKLMTDFCI
jgi:hypothetical protein